MYPIDGSAQQGGDVASQVVASVTEIAGLFWRYPGWRYNVCLRWNRVILIGLGMIQERKMAMATGDGGEGGTGSRLRCEAIWKRGAGGGGDWWFAL